MDDTTTTRDVVIGITLAVAMLLILTLIAGCNITAHVAARPVIDGTPVSVGVEWRDDR